MLRRRNRILGVAVATLLAACSGTDTAERTGQTIEAAATAGTGAEVTSEGSGPGDRTTPTTDAPPPTTDPAPVTTAAPTTVAPTTSAATTSAAATSTTAAPATTATTVAPTTTLVPPVDAAAYAVYDMRSGRVLASADADARLPVASLMKLLAAQTAYAAGDPAKVVVAPEGLLIDPEESRIGIRVGQELPRDLLVRAMLIVSANDAARALAVDIAGSEQAFAGRMNEVARSLGLADTQAVNATGLDAEGQFSTASDLTRLAAVMMGNATFQLTVRRPDAMLNGQTLPATNDLLTRYAGADGIKTGRTTAAGWCIVASATRDNRRIIATVLGAPTEEARDEAATALLDWGFDQP